MPKPTMQGGKLVATVRVPGLGEGAPTIPGLPEADTQVKIPRAHIVLTADHVCFNPACTCTDGDRCRCNTNVLLSNGQWVTIQGKHADVDALLDP